MSQRLFTFLLMVVLAITFGIAAWQTGTDFPIGNNLNDTLLLLAAPLILVSTTILGVFDTIDARVREGKLSAGDILGLFAMIEWWIGIVASTSGLLQLFGFAVLPPDTQAILVNLGLALATLLLRSLSNRPGTSPEPSNVIIAQRVYEQRAKG